MSFATAPTYTDAEVQSHIDAMMAVLPTGSSISSAIVNEGRTVMLDVRLPDNRKVETFEYGWVGRGGTKDGKSRLGRQGSPFDEFAVKAILQWSKS